MRFMKVRVSALLLVAVCGVLSSFAQEVDLAGLQARAAKGDAEAELELSRAYYSGKGVPKDLGKAADLLRQSATRGNAEAMYGLGFIYHRGLGVPHDDTVASQWFQKAADQGVARAELELGLDYFHGENGVKLDYAAAAKYLTMAAQQKNAPDQSAPAANALGNIYEHGLGVKVDGKQAVSWYTQAAELGSGKAKSNLGRVYQEAAVVKRDPILAYMWLKLAAFQGDPMATHLLGEFMAAKDFTHEQMAEGDRRVEDYQEKHQQPVVTGPAPMAVEPGTVKMLRSMTNAAGATAPGAAQPGH